MNTGGQSPLRAGAGGAVLPAGKNEREGEKEENSGRCCGGREKQTPPCCADIGRDEIPNAALPEGAALGAERGRGCCIPRTPAEGKNNI